MKLYIMNVKVGDYDLNGYLDLLVVLRDLNGTSRQAVLMKNVARETSGDNDTFRRSFAIDYTMTGLFAFTNVVQVSFFDLYDDGFLDILLTLKEGPAEGAARATYQLKAFRNEYFDDVYFMKIMGK